jgi:hypothetical protein
MAKFLEEFRKRRKRTEFDMYGTFSENGDLLYKICYECKQIKPTMDFYSAKNKKHGLADKCRSCIRIYKSQAIKIAYSKNPKFFTNKTKLWRIKNPEKHKKQTKQSKWKYQKIKNLDGSWFRLNNYLDFLKIQNGKCAICGIVFFKDSISYPADHCHKYGFVRGILCDSCNRGLGQFRDDINILKSAILYLEEFYGKIHKNQKS